MLRCRPRAFAGNGRCLAGARQPALQRVNLAREREDSLSEFIGIATATAVNDAGIEQGWKTNHNPADEKKEYVFHSDQVALSCAAL